MRVPILAGEQPFAEIRVGVLTSAVRNEIRTVLDPRGVDGAHRAARLDVRRHAAVAVDAAADPCDPERPEPARSRRARRGARPARRRVPRSGKLLRRHQRAALRGPHEGAARRRRRTSSPSWTTSKTRWRCSRRKASLMFSNSSMRALLPVARVGTESGGAGLGAPARRQPGAAARRARAGGQAVAGAAVDCARPSRGIRRRSRPSGC